MRYDFIGLSIQTINGVKNPLLTIVGTITAKKYKFIVEADGKEIPYTLDVITKDGDFALFSNVDTSVRNVKVYCIINNDKKLICSLNNKFLGRFYRKIKSELKLKENVIRAFFITIGKGIKFFWKEYHFLVPPKMWKKYWNHFWRRVEERGVRLYYNPFDTIDYNEWISKFEKIEKYQSQKYEPLISILIPVYNISEELLSKCLDSILNQYYQNFEICLVDDASTKEETIETLKKYQKIDKRIRVQFNKQNGHISKTTNAALKMASGEFVALMDDDDELAVNALSEVVLALNKNKKLDFIYSDEDKLNLEGKRCDPHFKPDYSPDTLLSLNYISHLGVIRKSLMIEVGGEETGLEGAQDYDLYLKIVEKTNNICHIPKILYHWRMVEGSTSMTIDNKNYAKDNGKKAIENALKRRKINGSVVKDEKSSYYIVNYDLKKEPLVSIIIPTRDYAETLETCLKSLFNLTSYKNYEVIVVNNNSEKEETFALFKKYQEKYKNFKVLDANYEFNYSKINNDAVKKCDGEYICLLNNDTEIISPDWLNVMVGYASQEHIGTVGPKLLYPDDTVQHAGIILGLGGVASHAYIGSSKDDPGAYGRLRVPYDYAGVTAACLVVSKKKYLEVGGLQEDLKVAYNDVDLNIKLLEKGYYNVCTPQVMLHHFESKSRGLDTTPEKLSRFYKEQNYMYEHWIKLIENDPFYNLNFSNRGWFMLPVDLKIDRNSLYKLDDGGEDEK